MHLLRLDIFIYLSKLLIRLLKLYNLTKFIFNDTIA